MYHINKKRVEELGKKKGAKCDRGFKDAELKHYFDMTVSNIIEFYSTKSSFDISQFINHIDHYFNDDKTNPVYKNYKVGEIVFVDFGATNFGYEISYPHPAIVLAQSEAFALLAPCSTKKYGHGFRDIFDGIEADGFYSDTGIILDNVRWASKGRIISSIGQTNEEFVKKVIDKIIELMKE